MELLLGSVLANIAGDFVDPTSLRGLRLTGLASEVLLRDLTLQPAAINRVLGDAPFTLLHGSVSSLKLVVPGGATALLSAWWSGTFAGSIRVVVDGAHVLLAKQAQSPADAASRAAAATKAALAWDAAQYQQQLIAAAQSAIGAAAARAAAAGDGGGLLESVLSGLQVEVTNIHVRIEDGTSMPRAPFAVGLAIAAIITDRAGSADAATAAVASPLPAGLLRRSVAIHQLAMYWDSAEALSATSAAAGAGAGAGRPDAAALTRRFAAGITNASQAPPHAFIIAPEAAPLSLTATLNPQGRVHGHPRLRVESRIPLLSAALDEVQAAQALALGSWWSESSGALLRAQLRQSLRPATPLDRALAKPAERRARARDWWRYAVRFVAGLRARQVATVRRWDARRVPGSLRLRQRYIAAYTEHVTAAYRAIHAALVAKGGDSAAAVAALDAIGGSKTAEALSAMEAGPLLYEQVLQFRAEARVTFEAEVMPTLARAKQPRTMAGWLGSFVYGDSSEAAGSPATPLPASPAAAASARTAAISQRFEASLRSHGGQQQLQAELVLGCLTISLFGRPGTPIISAKAAATAAIAVRSRGGMTVRGELSSLAVYDNVTTGSAYKVIMGPLGGAAARSKRVSTLPALTATAGGPGGGTPVAGTPAATPVPARPSPSAASAVAPALPLASFSFETQPDEATAAAAACPGADFVVTARCQPLQVVFAPACAAALSRYGALPQLAAAGSAVSAELASLTQQAAVDVYALLAAHRRIAVDVAVAGPVLYLPEDVCNASSRRACIRLGDLALQSVGEPMGLIQLEGAAGAARGATAMDAGFDSWRLQLANVAVAIETPRSQPAAGDGSGGAGATWLPTPILSPISLQATLQTSILPAAIAANRLRLATTIEAVEGHLSLPLLQYACGMAMVAAKLQAAVAREMAEAAAAFAALAVPPAAAPIAGVAASPAVSVASTSLRRAASAGTPSRAPRTPTVRTPTRESGTKEGGAALAPAVAAAGTAVVVANVTMRRVALTVHHASPIVTTVASARSIAAATRKPIVLDDAALALSAPPDFSIDVSGLQIGGGVSLTSAKLSASLHRLSVEAGSIDRLPIIDGCGVEADAPFVSLQLSFDARAMPAAGGDAAPVAAAASAGGSPLPSPAPRWPLSVTGAAGALRVQYEATSISMLHVAAVYGWKSLAEAAKRAAASGTGPLTISSPSPAPGPAAAAMTTTPARSLPADVWVTPASAATSIATSATPAAAAVAPAPAPGLALLHTIQSMHAAAVGEGAVDATAGAAVVAGSSEAVGFAPPPPLPPALLSACFSLSNFAVVLAERRVSGGGAGAPRGFNDIASIAVCRIVVTAEAGPTVQLVHGAVESAALVVHGVRDRGDATLLHISPGAGGGGQAVTVGVAAMSGSGAHPDRAAMPPAQVLLRGSIGRVAACYEAPAVARLYAALAEGLLATTIRASMRRRAKAVVAAGEAGGTRLRFEGDGGSATASPASSATPASIRSGIVHVGGHDGDGEAMRPAPDVVLHLSCETVEARFSSRQGHAVAADVAGVMVLVEQLAVSHEGGTTGMVAASLASQSRLLPLHATTTAAAAVATASTRPLALQLRSVTVSPCQMAADAPAHEALLQAANITVTVHPAPTASASAVSEMAVDVVLPPMRLQLDAADALLLHRVVAAATSAGAMAAATVAAAKAAAVASSDGAAVAGGGSSGKRALQDVEVLATQLLFGAAERSPLRISLDLNIAATVPVWQDAVVGAAIASRITLRCPSLDIALLASPTAPALRHLHRRPLFTGRLDDIGATISAHVGDGGAAAATVIAFGVRSLHAAMDEALAAAEAAAVGGGGSAADPAPSFVELLAVVSSAAAATPSPCLRVDITAGATASAIALADVALQVQELRLTLSPRAVLRLLGYIPPLLGDAAAAQGGATDSAVSPVAAPPVADPVSPPAAFRMCATVTGLQLSLHTEGEERVDAQVDGGVSVTTGIGASYRTPLAPDAVIIDTCNTVSLDKLGLTVSTPACRQPLLQCGEVSGRVIALARAVTMVPWASAIGIDSDSEQTESDSERASTTAIVSAAAPAAGPASAPAPTSQAEAIVTLRTEPLRVALALPTLRFLIALMAHSETAAALTLLGGGGRGDGSGGGEVASSLLRLEGVDFGGVEANIISAVHDDGRVAIRAHLGRVLVSGGGNPGGAMRITAEMELLASLWDERMAELQPLLAEPWRLAILVDARPAATAIEIRSVKPLEVRLLDTRVAAAMAELPLWTVPPSSSPVGGSAGVGSRIPPSAVRPAPAAATFAGALAADAPTPALTLRIAIPLLAADLSIDRGGGGETRIIRAFAVDADVHYVQVAAAATTPLDSAPDVLVAVTLRDVHVMDVMQRSAADHAVLFTSAPQHLARLAEVVAMSDEAAQLTAVGELAAAGREAASPALVSVLVCLGSQRDGGDGGTGGGVGEPWMSLAVTLGVIHLAWSSEAINMLLRALLTAFAAPTTAPLPVVPTASLAVPAAAPLAPMRVDVVLRDLRLLARADSASQAIANVTVAATSVTVQMGALDDGTRGAAALQVMGTLGQLVLRRGPVAMLATSPLRDASHAVRFSYAARDTASICDVAIGPVAAVYLHQPLLQIIDYVTSGVVAALLSALVPVTAPAAATAAPPFTLSLVLASASVLAPSRLPAVDVGLRVALGEVQVRGGDVVAAPPAPGAAVLRQQSMWSTVASALTLSVAGGAGADAPIGSLTSLRVGVVISDGVARRSGPPSGPPDSTVAVSVEVPTLSLAISPAAYAALRGFVDTNILAVEMATEAAVRAQCLQTFPTVPPSGRIVAFVASLSSAAAATPAASPSAPSLAEILAAIPALLARVSQCEQCSRRLNVVAAPKVLCEVCGDVLCLRCVAGGLYDEEARRKRSVCVRCADRLRPDMVAVPKDLTEGRAAAATRPLIPPPVATPLGATAVKTRVACPTAAITLVSGDPATPMCTATVMGLRVRVDTDSTDASTEVTVTIAGCEGTEPSSGVFLLMQPALTAPPTAAAAPSSAAAGRPAASAPPSPSAGGGGTSSPSALSYRQSMSADGSSATTLSVAALDVRPTPPLVAALLRFLAAYSPATAAGALPTGDALLLQPAMEAAAALISVEVSRLRLILPEPGTSSRCLLITIAEPAISATTSASQPAWSLWVPAPLASAVLNGDPSAAPLQARRVRLQPRSTRVTISLEGLSCSLCRMAASPTAPLQLDDAVTLLLEPLQLSATAAITQRVMVALADSLPLDLATAAVLATGSDLAPRTKAAVIVSSMLRASVGVAELALVQRVAAGWSDATAANADPAAAVAAMEVPPSAYPVAAWGWAPHDVLVAFPAGCAMGIRPLVHTAAPSLITHSLGSVDRAQRFDAGYGLADYTVTPVARSGAVEEGDLLVSVIGGGDRWATRRRLLGSTVEQVRDAIVRSTGARWLQVRPWLLRLTVQLHAGASVAVLNNHAGRSHPVGTVHLHGTRLLLESTGVDIAGSVVRGLPLRVGDLIEGVVVNGGSAVERSRAIAVRNAGAAAAVTAADAVTMVARRGAQLVLDAGTTLSVEVFNQRNGHNEPLLEPVKLSAVAASVDDTCVERGGLGGDAVGTLPARSLQLVLDEARINVSPAALATLASSLASFQSAIADARGSAIDLAAVSSRATRLAGRVMRAPAGVTPTAMPFVLTNDTGVAIAVSIRPALPSAATAVMIACDADVVASDLGLAHDASSVATARGADPAALAFAALLLPPGARIGYICHSHPAQLTAVAAGRYDLHAACEQHSPSAVMMFVQVVEPRLPGVFALPIQRRPGQRRVEARSQASLGLVEAGAAAEAAGSAHHDDAMSHVARQYPLLVEESRGGGHHAISISSSVRIVNLCDVAVRLYTQGEAKAAVSLFHRALPSNSDTVVPLSLVRDAYLRVSPAPLDDNADDSACPYGLSGCFPLRDIRTSVGDDAATSEEWDMVTTTKRVGSGSGGGARVGSSPAPSTMAAVSYGLMCKERSTAPRSDAPTKGGSAGSDDAAMLLPPFHLVATALPMGAGGLVIVLAPPLRLTNSLPVPVRTTLLGNGASASHSCMLQPGESTPVHFVTAAAVAPSFVTADATLVANTVTAIGMRELLTPTFASCREVAIRVTADALAAAGDDQTQTYPLAVCVWPPAGTTWRSAGSPPPTTPPSSAVYLTVRPRYLSHTAFHAAHARTRTRIVTVATAGDGAIRRLTTGYDAALYRAVPAHALLQLSVELAAPAIIVNATGLPLTLGLAMAGKRDDGRSSSDTGIGVHSPALPTTTDRVQQLAAPSLPISSIAIGDLLSAAVDQARSTATHARSLPHSVSTSSATVDGTLAQIEPLRNAVQRLAVPRSDVPAMLAPACLHFQSSWRDMVVKVRHQVADPPPTPRTPAAAIAGAKVATPTAAAATLWCGGAVDMLATPQAVQPLLVPLSIAGAAGAGAVVTRSTAAMHVVASVTTAPAPFQASRIVTLRPRFVLINGTGSSLAWRQGLHDPAASIPWLAGVSGVSPAALLPEHEMARATAVNVVWDFCAVEAASAAPSTPLLLQFSPAAAYGGWSPPIDVTAYDGTDVRLPLAVTCNAGPPSYVHTAFGHAAAATVVVCVHLRPDDTAPGTTLITVTLQTHPLRPLRPPVAAVTSGPADDLTTIVNAHIQDNLRVYGPSAPAPGVATPLPEAARAPAARDVADLAEPPSLAAFNLTTGYTLVLSQMQPRVFREWGAILSDAEQVAAAATLRRQVASEAAIGVAGASLGVAFATALTIVPPCTMTPLGLRDPLFTNATPVRLRVTVVADGGRELAPIEVDLSAIGFTRVLVAGDGSGTAVVVTLRLTRHTLKLAAVERRIDVPLERLRRSGGDAAVSEALARHIQSSLDDPRRHMLEELALRQPLHFTDPLDHMPVVLPQRRLIRAASAGAGAGADAVSSALAPDAWIDMALMPDLAPRVRVWRDNVDVNVDALVVAAIDATPAERFVMEARRLRARVVVASTETFAGVAVGAITFFDVTRHSHFPMLLACEPARTSGRAGVVATRPPRVLGADVAPADFVAIGDGAGVGASAGAGTSERLSPALEFVVTLAQDGGAASDWAVVPVRAARFGLQPVQAAVSYGAIARVAMLVQALLAAAGEAGNSDGGGDAGTAPHSGVMLPREAAATARSLLEITLSGTIARAALSDELVEPHDGGGAIIGVGPRMLAVLSPAAAAHDVAATAAVKRDTTVGAVPLLIQQADTQQLQVQAWYARGATAEEEAEDDADETYGDADDDVEGGGGGGGGVGGGAHGVVIDYAAAIGDLFEGVPFIGKVLNSPLTVDGAKITLELPPLTGAATTAALAARIKAAVADQVLHQVPALLGAVNAALNPIAIGVSTVTGLADIGRGIASFDMRTAAAGAGSTMGTVIGAAAGAVGAVADAATFADSTIAGHRAASRAADERPTGLVDGLGRGLTTFATRLGGAVVGVVAKPVEGLRRGGVVGLAQGVMSAGVGLVTQPVAAVAGGVSQVLQGVEAQVNPSIAATIVAGEAARQRRAQARPFYGRDRVLMPITSSLEFVAAARVGGRRHPGEWLAYLAGTSSGIAAVVTNQRVLRLHRESSDAATPTAAAGAGGAASMDSASTSYRQLDVSAWVETDVPLRKVGSVEVSASSGGSAAVAVYAGPSRDSAALRGAAPTLTRSPLLLFSCGTLEEARALKTAIDVARGAHAAGGALKSAGIRGLA